MSSITWSVREPTEFREVLLPPDKDLEKNGRSHDADGDPEEHITTSPRITYIQKFMIIDDRK